MDEHDVRSSLVSGAGRILALLLLLAPTGASAQLSSPSVLAIDSSVAFDQRVDPDGDFATGTILDGVVSADLGGGFEGLVRPFAQRRASGEWNPQIWMAALRYQRTGTIDVRVDGGLIPSPLGLANLTLRPHLNPTIAQPSSLFTPLPGGWPGAPRLNLLGAVYPLGAQVTVSQLHWDARAAIIDASPVRPRRVFARANPPRFANVVLGGGVTPFVGFRVGASVTRGGWLRAGEASGAAGDLGATVVTVESELAFRYTKVTGEWVRDALDTGAEDYVASGWYLQGQQTLTPRWFVAGRVERMSAPLVLPSARVEQHFVGFEETIGYRLTPEITFRAAHRARRGFGAGGYDHQAAVSVVWWRRWM